MMPQQMVMQAQPAYYSEPGCAYVEAGCGAPFMGGNVVGYGPSMPCDCGACGACGCDSGCCGAEGAPLSAPIPQATPTPVD
jgi:hypothetical protein